MNRFIPIIAAGFLLVLAGCKEHKTETKTKKLFCLSDTVQKMIAIDTVNFCSIDDEIQLTGEVGFDENKIIKIFPRSSGQVVECKVSLGDKVTAGQVLAVIRSADVAGNYADLASAEADVKIALRQLNNTSSLYQSGIASERELTEAKENYEKALALKRKISSQISINGGSGARAGGVYTITSPINGYIVEKKVNAGNFIRSDNADNLFTISDLKDVWVLANVFEVDIPRVKEGLQVRVITLAYPDKAFTGTIEKISEVLDPANKALRVRIRLNNSCLLLKPEMFTKVIVSNKGGEGNAICIPASSIVEENGKTYVVVYNGDCNVAVQQVDIFKEQGDKAYLKSGLKPGQKLITKNALLIYDELSDNQ